MEEEKTSISMGVLREKNVSVFVNFFFFFARMSLMKRDTPEPLSTSIPPNHFHFLIFLSFSLKLIHLCLVKSLMKPETLDGASPWPSTQMVIVKTNNPYHHLSNRYLFHSLFFPRLSIVFTFYILAIELKYRKLKNFNLKKFFIE